MRKQSLPTFAWNIRENRIGHSRGTPHAHASCQDYFSSDRNISCMSVVPHKVEKVRLQFKFVHAYAIIRLGGGAVSKLTPLWHHIFFKKCSFFPFESLLTSTKLNTKRFILFTSVLDLFSSGTEPDCANCVKMVISFETMRENNQTSNRFKQEGFCPEKSLA